MNKLFKSHCLYLCTDDRNKVYQVYIFDDEVDENYDEMLDQLEAEYYGWDE